MGKQTDGQTQPDRHSLPVLYKPLWGVLRMGPLLTLTAIHVSHHALYPTRSERVPQEQQQTTMLHHQQVTVIDYSCICLNYESPKDC